MDDQSGKNRGLDLGCSPQLVLLTVTILILAVVAIGLLNREPSEADLARSQLQIERAEAFQPWTVALGVALRLLVIGAGLVLVLGLAAAVRAAVRWLDTQARLIRPDRETGQFPAVKVRRGEAVVDLNRLPDGKAMTGVVGGKTALLLVLLFRYVFHKEVPELTEQPAVIVTPPDVSPEQLQITGQAQIGQALAAASRGMSPQQAGQAVQALLPGQRLERGLPPLLVEERQPREVQLLLEAGKRQWDQRGETIDGTRERG